MSLAFAREQPIVDWLKIESSAPGKFIISGEYAVVYEKQAIAATIDLRTRVSITPNKDQKLRLHLKNLKNSREWPLSSLLMCKLVPRYSECLEFEISMVQQLNHLLHQRFFVTPPPSTSSTDNTSPPKHDKPSSPQPSTTSDTPNPPDPESKQKQKSKQADDAAMAFLLLYIGLGDSYAASARPPLDVVVESDLPVGSGLGSSSAYAVSLCGALMKVFRVVAEKYIISTWAFQIDRFFHGRPSGVDNNVAALGGYILFHNGKVKGMGIASKPIRVILIDTGVSRSTRALCEIVSTQMRLNQARTTQKMTRINEITVQIWKKMNDSNFSPLTIGSLIVENQALLDSLGVGHPKLQEIFQLAYRHGLAAKQTGAGGGGTAFVLYDETEDLRSVNLLKEDFERNDFHIYDLKIGGEGLLVNVTRDPSVE